jgi:hypothetical protein
MIESAVASHQDEEPPSWTYHGLKHFNNDGRCKRLSGIKFILTGGGITTQLVRHAAAGAKTIPAEKLRWLRRVDATKTQPNISQMSGGENGFGNSKQARRVTEHDAEVRGF